MVIAVRTNTLEFHPNSAQPRNVLLAALGAKSIDMISGKETLLGIVNPNAKACLQ